MGALTAALEALLLLLLLTPAATAPPQRKRQAPRRRMPRGQFKLKAFAVATPKAPPADWSGAYEFTTMVRRDESAARDVEVEPASEDGEVHGRRTGEERRGRSARRRAGGEGVRQPAERGRHQLDDDGEPQQAISTDASVTQQDLCYTRPEHFDGPLAGRWEETEAEAPYWKLSCKSLQAVWSCSYYEDPVNQRAKRLARLRYLPSACHLRKFDGDAFLKSLEGRTLVLAGDSVTQQMFVSLVCRLEEFETAYHIRWGTQMKSQLKYCGPNGKCMDKIKKGYNAHFLESPENPQWVEYKYNVTVRYVSIKAESMVEKMDYIASFASTKDLVVLNKGAWRQSGYEDMRQRYIRFVAAYRTNRDRWPTIWWRETSPQHFEGESGDFVPGRRVEGATCVKPSLSRLSMSHVDPINEIANSIIGPAGVPIMYTSQALVSEYDAHLFKNGRDCTHVCLPGVEVMWLEVLQGWLLVGRHEARTRTL